MRRSPTQALLVAALAVALASPAAAQVQSVIATYPIVSSGGTRPNISLQYGAGLTGAGGVLAFNYAAPFYLQSGAQFLPTLNQPAVLARCSTFPNSSSDCFDLLAQNNAKILWVDRSAGLNYQGGPLYFAPAGDSSIYDTGRLSVSGTQGVQFSAGATGSPSLVVQADGQTVTVQKLYVATDAAVAGSLAASAASIAGLNVTGSLSAPQATVGAVAAGSASVAGVLSTSPGASLDSTGGTLSPTAMVHHVTGDGTVTAITAPPGFAGGTIALWVDGNCSILGTAFAPGSVALLLYDGSAWVVK